MDAVIEKIEALQREAEIENERAKQLCVTLKGAATPPPSKKPKRASNGSPGRQLLNAVSPSSSTLRGCKVLVHPWLMILCMLNLTHSNNQLRRGCNQFSGPLNVQTPCLVTRSRCSLSFRYLSFDPLFNAERRTNQLAAHRLRSTFRSSELLVVKLSNITYWEYSENIFYGGNM
jgi:hypothetical protein